MQTTAKKRKNNPNKSQKTTHTTEIYLAGIYQL